MSRAVLGLVLLSLAVGVGAAVLVHWFAGVFIAYRAIWFTVVERTVGVRNFAFFDTRDSPPRVTASRRWAIWMVVALVLSGAITFIGVRTRDPLAFAGLLLAVNALYTIWAIPFVGSRLRRVR